MKSAVKIDEKKIFFASFAVDVVLLVLLVLSFALNRGTENVHVNTVLLNPSYKEKVQRIVIKSPAMKVASSDSASLALQTEIQLEKHDRLWTGRTIYNGWQGSGVEEKKSSVFNSMEGSDIWPANSVLVNELIESSIKIQKLYKKSYTKKNFEDLSLSESSALQLVFQDARGNEFSHLYFGAQDELNLKTLLRSLKKDTVYAIDNSYTASLSYDENHWADLQLFPQLFDSEKKHVDLRRGSLCSSFTPYRTDSSRTENFIFDLENGSRVILKCSPVFLTDGTTDDYVVTPSFTAGPAFSSTEKEAASSFSYSYIINDWTYSKLKNIK